jgi:RNA polymerase sigma factor (sigma-70 family)
VSSSYVTRWTVIQRAADGNPAGRDEFVGAYGKVIRAYLDARWRGTPLADQVDDAAQQVFLDCFKDDGALGRADGQRTTGFRAFLYGIVRNVARGMERTHARSSAHQDSGIDVDQLKSKEESLVRIFDRAWASALLSDAARVQLERARAKGPEALRRNRLLELRYGENLPIREIAKRWDVDPAWLHGQFRQSRDEYRSALEQVVRELHGDDESVSPESVADECRRLLQFFS